MNSGCGMKDEIDIRRARALVRDGRLWPLVMRRCFCDPGRKPFFHDFPADDGSRIALLGDATRRAVENWLEVIARADELGGALDGERVKVLREEYGDAYPDAIRYAPYFAKWHLPAADGGRLLATAMRTAPAELLEAEPLEGTEVPLAAVLKLLKLRFSEAYDLCCS